MAIGEVVEFITGSVGLALAALAVAITVGVFAVIARIGNSAQPTTDEE